MTKYIKTGKIYFTRSIYNLMNTDKLFGQFIVNSLKKYLSCDWGNTCEEDSILNDHAQENGDRIVALYIDPVSKKEIFIITESDCSATTILFTSEY